MLSTYFTLIALGIAGWIGIDLILKSLKRIEDKLGTNNKKKGIS